MPEVGSILREAREAKNVDLKEVERVLKIRRKFLNALETDQPISELNDIYVRSFLKGYAAYLGLDPEHIAQLYGIGPVSAEPVHQAQPIPTAPTFSAMDTGKEQEPPGSRMRGIVVPLAGIVIGVVIVLVGASMVRKASSLSPAETTRAPEQTHEIGVSQTVSQTAGIEVTPHLSPTITSTPTRTPTPTSTPTVTPTPTPEFYTGVTIELIASASAWTQILVDGKKTFEGMLEPGMRRHWRGEDRVEVRCGNAGGVEAVVNGESIGFLGEEGQVVDMEWQKETGPPPAPDPTEPELTPTSDVVAAELITATQSQTQ